jgi:hypothetical protein
MDASLDDAVPRFKRDLPRLTAMLRGEDLGQLADDRALRACGPAPVTVVSTAMSTAAVRRAAAAGAGILYDGASDVDRLRGLSDAYDAAGGTAPKVLIRRVWLGAPPSDAFDRQVDIYREYSPAAAQEHWRDNGWLCRDDPAELADDLRRALAASGADALNVRVHVPGVAPDAAREQIARLGDEVLPHLR